MPAGRRPKPTLLHLMHGTFRADRHGDRAEAMRKFWPRDVPPPATKPAPRIGPSSWPEVLNLPEVCQDDDKPPPAAA